MYFLPAQIFGTDHYGSHFLYVISEDGTEPGMSAFAQNWDPDYSAQQGSTSIVLKLQAGQQVDMLKYRYLILIYFTKL